MSNSQSQRNAYLSKLSWEQLVLLFKETNKSKGYSLNKKIARHDGNVAGVEYRKGATATVELDLLIDCSLDYDLYKKCAKEVREKDYIRNSLPHVVKGELEKAYWQAQNPLNKFLVDIGVIPKIGGL